jgi:hypothetical protein
MENPIQLRKLKDMKDKIKAIIAFIIGFVSFQLLFHLVILK